MNEWGREFDRRGMEDQTVLTVVIGEGSFIKGVYGKGKEGWQLEDTLDHFSKI